MAKILRTEDMPNLMPFRELQRQRQDYFAHFRRGETWFVDRRHEWINLPIPRPGAWRGYDVNYRNPNWTRNIHKLENVWAHQGPLQTRDDALQANKRLAGAMHVAGFRHVKILGWGGLGVASLYEAIGRGRNRLKVVCKIDIFPQHPCIPHEVKAHLMTAGAKHVMQQVVLSAEGGVSPEILAKLGEMAKQTAVGVDMTEHRSLNAANQKRKRDDDDDFEMVEAEPIGEFEELDANVIREGMKLDARKYLDEHQQVLFIQFMNRGRLDDHICRAAAHKKPFPSLVLWQVFDCLFRGVIGMAYPEAFMPWNVDPSKVQVPEVTETSRGLKPLDPYDERDTMVHFDIDPLNILVDAFDENEHNLAPLVKIADLGLVKSFNSRTGAFEYWSSRTTGKTSVYTPEQFSEEWDYINGNPRTINSETAGNYNWWTNLYQIALIMWQMVALCHPESPPVVELCIIKLLDGTEATEYGFGGYILNDKKFSHIDRDLRELISQCMLHRPSRRPTMEQLESVLESKTKRQGVDATNAEEVEAQRYCEWLFKGPAAPKPPQPRDYKLPEGLRGWTMRMEEEPRKAWIETPEEAARRRELHRPAKKRRINVGRVLSNKFAVVRNVSNMWGNYFKKS
ncbi:hypothetical protein QBC40DRAFT_167067 [Triangularia verruculosa]|uniref:Protein kinase domain-containing protein n=1 Tax=Triangularia verruculosa TaxID=2587418 RepID=A0AAN6XPM9_9PEZI|nr:hypothetical protein QBC40DRAFT_167067 [Triangularia verruculosa]